MDFLKTFTKADVAITAGTLSSPFWLNYVNAIGAVFLTLCGFVLVYWKIREARAKALRAEAMVDSLDDEDAP